MSYSINNNFTAPDAHAGDSLTEHNLHKVISSTGETPHDSETGEMDIANRGYTIKDCDDDGISDVESVRPVSNENWPIYVNPLANLTNEEWVGQQPQKSIHMKDGSTEDSGVFTKIPYATIEPGRFTLTSRMPDTITGKYTSAISKSQILPATLLDTENGKRRCLLSEQSTIEGSKYLLMKISELPEPTNVFPTADQARASTGSEGEGTQEGKAKENEADTKRVSHRTELFENKNPEYSCFVAGYYQQSFAEKLEFDTENGRIDTVEHGQEGNTERSQDVNVSPNMEFTEDEDNGIDYLKSHFVGVFDPLLKCRCSGDTHDAGSRPSKVNGYIKCPRTIYSGIEPDHIKAIYRSLKDSRPYISRPTELVYQMTKAAWSIGKMISHLQQTDPLTADDNLRMYTDEHGEHEGNEPLFKVVPLHTESSDNTKDTAGGYGDNKDDISNRGFDFDTSNPSVPKCSIMFFNKEDWSNRKQEVEEMIKIYEVTQQELMKKKRDQSIRLDHVPMPTQDPNTSHWGATTTRQAVQNIEYLRRLRNQDRANLGLSGHEVRLQDWASRKWTNDPSSLAPIEPVAEFQAAKLLE